MINEDYWFVILRTKRKRIYIFAKSRALLVKVVQELNEKHAFSASKITTIRQSEEISFDRFYMEHKAALMKHSNFAILEA